MVKFWPESERFIPSPSLLCLLALSCIRLRSGLFLVFQIRFLFLDDWGNCYFSLICHSRQGLLYRIQKRKGAFSVLIGPPAALPGSKGSLSWTRGFGQGKGKGYFIFLDDNSFAEILFVVIIFVLWRTLLYFGNGNVLGVLLRGMESLARRFSSSGLSACRIL